ncbi:MAG: MaoC family dehydratase [Pseudomonadota bacterium]|nr:MaoC family dehydratase [Pseudomonadota bacterium]
MTHIVSPPSRPAVRLYWEDFVVGQTREFGHYLVTRPAVLQFARQFDPQPFHIDDEAAGQSLFGRLAASGWHTCAMAMRMMCDGYLLESASLGSPGIERLTWPHPVFPGDTLRMRSTVLASRALDSRPTVGLVRSNSEMLNQDDQIVLTMEGAGFFGRRHAAAPPPTA